MKRNVALLLLIAAVVIAACSATKTAGTSSPQSNNHTEKIRKFWEFGASLEQAAESDFVENRSYIKGLRSMYGYFRQNGMGIKAMQAISPVPIFVSGPHGTGNELEINLTANTFGHYNIEFFEWAQDHLIPGTSDETFRRVTQPIYQAYVGDLARVYYDAYYFLRATDASQVEIAKELYLARIVELKGTPNTFEFNAGPGREIYMLFDYAYAHESRGFHDPDYIEYNAFVAPGFWIRRDIDGTDREAFTLLEKLLLTYDADFVRDIKAYYGK